LLAESFDEVFRILKELKEEIKEEKVEKMIGTMIALEVRYKNWISKRHPLGLKKRDSIKANMIQTFNTTYKLVLVAIDHVDNGD
jgi:hypothetical protein